MPGITNRGKYIILQAVFEAASIPTGFKLALITSASAPGADTNALTDHTEIATGNGYTAGGNTVALSTGFDSLTEDDANDRAYVQLINNSFVASGGPIPSSGSGARYALLIDNNNNVIAYWDFVTDQTVSDGQSIIVQDAELRLGE